jgi:hypothetical protein
VSAEAQGQQLGQGSQVGQVIQDPHSAVATTDGAAAAAQPAQQQTSQQGMSGGMMGGGAKGGEGGKDITHKSKYKITPTREQVFGKPRKTPPRVLGRD